MVVIGQLLPFALDFFREARWWTASGSCSTPWGAILLAVTLAFVAGCLTGGVVAVLCLSRSVRSFVLRCLSAAVQAAGQGDRAGDLVEHAGPEVLVHYRRRPRNA